MAAHGGAGAVGGGGAAVEARSRPVLGADYAASRLSLSAGGLEELARFRADRDILVVSATGQAK